MGPAVEDASGVQEEVEVFIKPVELREIFIAPCVNFGNGSLPGVTRSWDK